jgi:hypothetical protein
VRNDAVVGGEDAADRQTVARWLSGKRAPCTATGNSHSALILILLALLDNASRFFEREKTASIKTIKHESPYRGKKEKKLRGLRQC